LNINSGVLTIRGQQGINEWVRDARDARAVIRNINSIIMRNVPKTANITTIPAHAFSLSSGYRNLTSVGMPNTVTRIGESAFDGCRDLKTIRITGGKPNFVAIGEKAFKDCTNLNFSELFEFPRGITIGTSAFEGCTNLNQEIIIESGANIGNSAFRRTGDTNVTIEEGATIRAFAFDNCVLRRMEFIDSPNPNNYRFRSLIHARAFENARINRLTITLPDGSSRRAWETALRTVGLEDANIVIENAPPRRPGSFLKQLLKR
jgi:hypothetical protein